MRGAREFEARRRELGGHRPRLLHRCLFFVLASTVVLAIAGWLYYFFSVTGDLQRSVREGSQALRQATAKLKNAPASGHGEYGSLSHLSLSTSGSNGFDSTSLPSGNLDPVLYLYKDDRCQGAVIGEIRPMKALQNDLHGICEYQAGSMKLVGGPEADFYSSCQHDRYYVGSLFASEGCVKRYNYPSAKSFRFRWTSSLTIKQISDSLLDTQWALQDHKPVKSPGEPAKARIVFSAESSEYFGYQVWANYYGYLTSGQKSASWTRLLTAGKRDDLSEQVKGLATFQAKRTLFSRRYSPINKPDVIAKWFASVDRPKEEVIVVIDPDNWLLKDISQYVDQVTPGNALGEPAYYHGSRSAQRLWKEVCKNNCEADVDLVGVPYIVHRDDLARIAPLWREYTIMIKDRVDSDKEFKDKYGHLDLAWASEMFGYNFAAAHAGVKHKVIPRIQVRDVDSEHRKEKLQEVSMLHVGRAWFPVSYTPAQRWAHTEGKSFSRFGQQVWCKCNNTASTVIPWPVPPDADFQSTKTLEILHYSHERFGPIPVNKEFRRGISRGEYGASVD